MNVTFLIGNGFDLNLGLKTRYQDFYKYYHSLPGSDTDIIAKSIKKDYKLWSDLELGLGAFLKDLGSDDIPGFLDSKNKLEIALVNYLKEQEARIQIKDQNALASEFRDSVISFFLDFSLSEQTFYKDFLTHENSSMHYSFVTFNYTRVLDSIIAACKTLKPFSTHTCGNYVYQDTIDAPLHIHGTIEKDLILGVDSPEQIQNNILKTRPDLTDYIVKPVVNKSLGEMNISRFEQIVNSSQYICLFGLSLGDTDQTWWKILISWLAKSEKNRLVIYTKNQGLVFISAGAKIKSRDEERKHFKRQSLCKEDIYDKIREQIIVIQNSDIFKLENLQIQGEKADAPTAKKAV